MKLIKRLWGKVDIYFVFVDLWAPAGFHTLPKTSNLFLKLKNISSFHSVLFGVRQNAFSAYADSSSGVVWMHKWSRFGSFQTSKCHAAWVWEVWGLECVTAGCPSLADEAGSWMMGVHGAVWRRRRPGRRGVCWWGDRPSVRTWKWYTFRGFSPMRQWSRSPGSGA